MTAEPGGAGINSQSSLSFPTWIDALSSDARLLVEASQQNPPVQLRINGHVAEGAWTPAGGEGEYTFNGHLICGPHDDAGKHVTEETS